MTEKRQAKAGDWSPAEPRPDGTFLCGDALPLNHRLRAEALVAAGKRTDPGGMIGDELIADTAARLKAEAGAAAGADKPLSEQTKAQLHATARREEIALPAKGTNADLVAAIEAGRAAKLPPATPAEGTNDQ